MIDWKMEAERANRLYAAASHHIEALEAALPECTKQLEENTATMRMASARIEALEKALRRIDAINDSPAIFNKDIDDVCRAALTPEQDK